MININEKLIVKYVYLNVLHSAPAGSTFNVNHIIDISQLTANLRLRILDKFIVFLQLSFYFFVIVAVSNGVHGAFFAYVFIQLVPLICYYLYVIRNRRMKFNRNHVHPSCVVHAQCAINNWSELMHFDLMFQFDDFPNTKKCNELLNGAINLKWDRLEVYFLHPECSNPKILIPSESSQEKTLFFVLVQFVVFLLFECALASFSNKLSHNHNNEAKDIDVDVQMYAPYLVNNVYIYWHVRVLFIYSLFVMQCQSCILQCIGGNNALGLLLWSMYMLSVNLLLFDQVLFGWNKSSCLLWIFPLSMCVCIVHLFVHFFLLVPFSLVG